MKRKDCILSKLSETRRVIGQWEGVRQGDTSVRNLVEIRAGDSVEDNTGEDCIRGHQRIVPKWRKLCTYTC